MKKKQLLIKIRTKKLGLLILNARQIADRSVESCAEACGVNAETFKLYENGEQAPTLPQLEVLAGYLNLPLDHFEEGSILASTNKEIFLEETKQHISSREEAIADMLKNFRLETGLNFEELAEESGISAERIEELEEAQNTPSLPELENLATALEVNLSNFFDNNTVNSLSQPADVQNILELPKDIRDFVSQTINLPYLELAMHLSEMPADKLRTIAESLLEITF